MYRISTSKQRSSNTKRLALVPIVAIAAFILVFMGTQSLMHLVYGQVVFTPLDNTSNQIDNYISLIKSEICPTLVNTTEQAECYKF